MEIDAEIDTLVTAFVADIAGLVRRSALDGVRDAFARLDLAAPTKRAQPARRRSAKRVLAAAPPPRAASLAGAVPSPAPTPLPAPAAPVVVQRIPPPRRRSEKADRPAPAARAPASHAVAATPAEASGRRWVVVRRPPRDRSGGSRTEGPTAPVGGAAAPPLPDPARRESPAT